MMPGLNDHIAATERALTIVLADLAELRESLAALAELAEVQLSDERYDRQLSAEHLVDRLTILSGGGK